MDWSYANCHSKDFECTAFTSKQALAFSKNAEQLIHDKDMSTGNMRLTCRSAKGNLVRIWVEQNPDVTVLWIIHLLRAARLACTAELHHN